MEQALDGLPNLLELIDVEDLRHHQRFVVVRPLRGELMGSPARILDLSVGGFGLSHPLHVRVGSSHPLRIRDSEFGEVIPFHTTVMWSRISGEKDDRGALLYASGVRIDDDISEVGGKIGRLLRYYGKPDSTSLGKKRVQALERLMKRVTSERKLLLDLEPEELLLSYQALAGTSRMTEEDKADLVRGANEILARDARPTGWNRDVLAAWKSVDGKVELATIDAARKILSEIDRFVHKHG